MMDEEETLTSGDGANCPACGRFIGPAGTCPYCESAARKSPMLRLLRYGSVLLGVVGLLFLHLMVTTRDLPPVRIAEITPTMNFAYVRIEGKVVRDAYVSREKGKVSYVSFMVDDGSGDIRVAAYRDVAQRVVDDALLPKAGQRVEIAGSLSVTEDKGARLRLQTARQLHLLGPAGAARGPSRP